MEVVVAAPGTILHGFLCDDVDGMINAVEMTELTSLTCPERVKRQKNKENNWQGTESHTQDKDEKENEEKNNMQRKKGEVSRCFEVMKLPTWSCLFFRRKEIEE